MLSNPHRVQDLYAAGLIRVAELPAAAEYWADTTQWSQLLGGSQKLVYWGYWREFITYACAAVHWEAESKSRVLGEYSRGAMLRELAGVPQAPGRVHG